MTSYKHTQIGYLMLFTLFILILIYVWMYGVIQATAGNNIPIIIAMAAILTIVSMFSTLTVEIAERDLRIKFGFGLYRKKFPLVEIASVKAVKNHWYYGWGIRVWLWPRLTIYNVSGFDAVEIVMKNGKVYRIGTDEPAVLETAIRQKINYFYGRTTLFSAPAGD